MKINISPTFIPSFSQRFFANINGPNQPQSETMDSPTKTTIKIIPADSLFLEDASEPRNSPFENAPTSRSGRNKTLRKLAQAVLFTNKIKKKEPVTSGFSSEINPRFKKFVRENFSLVTEDMLTRNVSLENETDSKVY